MSNILFLPHPLREESPTSMLRRMATLHGCQVRTDLRDLFGKANYYESILTRTHPIVQAVATKSRWDAERFLSGFYEPVGPLPIAPPLKIGGQVVRAEMVRKSQAAFCSECWAAGQEYFIKDLRLAVYCPYHLRQYLSKCPACHTDLYWCNLLSGRCHCEELPTSPTCTHEDAIIERKILNLFREGDDDRFKKFEDNLMLMDFVTKNNFECSATRTIAMIALSLLDMDQEAILRNLETLQALYPGIPKRIICAKLSLTAARQHQDSIKVFLRQNNNTITQQQINASKLLPTFCLTGRQIRTWQRLPTHQWKTVRKTSNVLKLTGRYCWQEAQAMSEHILQLRLNNSFSKKTTTSGIQIGELRKNLMVSAIVMREIINENLFHPISWRQNSYLFDPKDIESFSQHYISVRKLSANTQIPIRKIRSALRHLGPRDPKLKNHIVRSHIMSIGTSKKVVERCTPHSNKYQKREEEWFGLPRHHPDQAGVWLNSSAAAAFLGVWPPQIGHFIVAGLIAASVGGSRNNAYLIEEEALTEFKRNYISVTEAAKLLGLTLHSTSTKLKDAGLAPVTGPGIDKNPSYHFIRSEVLTLKRTTQESVKTNNLSITKHEASRRLHLPHETILKLANAKILEVAEPVDSLRKLLKKQSVDEFYDHYASQITVANWLNIPTRCVVQALSRFGINPLPGLAPQSAKTLFYRIDDISEIFSLPCRPESIGFKAGKLLILDKVSTFRVKLQLPAVPFYRLFIASGLVIPIGNHEPTYLLESDTLKVSQIMEKYCIISQANKFLGHPHFAYNLVRTKKITVSHPLSPHTNYPMIERAALHAYALNRHI